MSSELVVLLRLTNQRIQLGLTRGQESAHRLAYTTRLILWPCREAAFAYLACKIWHCTLKKHTLTWQMFIFNSNTLLVHFVIAPFTRKTKLNAYFLINIWKKYYKWCELQLFEICLSSRNHHQHMCSYSVVAMAPSDSSISEPGGCGGKSTLVLEAAKYTETFTNLPYVFRFSEPSTC